jgi:hypothetical protein
LQVRITQKGGFAGLKMAADVDTQELDGEDATRVERSLEQLLDRSEPAQPPRPDGFEYHFAVPERGEDAKVVVPEHELPPELKPLLAEFRKKSSPGGA